MPRGNRRRESERNQGDALANDAQALQNRYGRSQPVSQPQPESKPKPQATGKPRETSAQRRRRRNRGGTATD